MTESFKREVTSTCINAKKESKRMSSTESELTTKSMVSGPLIKMEFFLRLVKTLTILPTSREGSTSMSNSLLTRSEFTSQVLRLLEPERDTSVEELMLLSLSKKKMQMRLRMVLERKTETKPHTPTEPLWTSILLLFKVLDTVMLGPVRRISS